MSYHKLLMYGIPYHSMQQSIDFECKECGEVCFNMPKIEVQRHMLKHKIDLLADVDIYRIAHKDYYVDVIGQAISRLPKGTMPKGW